MALKRSSVRFRLAPPSIIGNVEVIKHRSLPVKLEHRLIADPLFSRDLGPYPVQRGLTAAMREAGAKAREVQRMQAWAGQAAAFARAEPAAELVRRLWREAEAFLPSVH